MIRKKIALRVHIYPPRAENAAENRLMVYGHESSTSGHCGNEISKSGRSDCVQYTGHTEGFARILQQLFKSYISPHFPLVSLVVVDCVSQLVAGK